VTSLLLVGNGSSLLGKGLGVKIDSFDEIVRFNNFELDGYAEDVGSKTTILARRSCDDVKLWPEEMFSRVYCFVTFCRWTSGMLHVANQLHGYYSNIDIITPDICAGYGREIGLDQPENEWASVGALALAHFIKTHKKIYICGFDHLKKDENGKASHYFHKPPKDDRFHSESKERAFTETLIKGGFIERIDL
jgi:hypothetical protein|tara:strand:+ start:85 stop:660 length:576 start_codon:yes stop_codon:yes gene_type:complete